jgi:hypothetical protein
MANRRFIDFPIAASVGNDDIVLIWQDGVNKQTTKATLFAGSPNSLAGLTDVDISALANGQILQYNSTTSKWENVDRTDIDLDQLGDVTIVSPTNGQVLVYNSSTSKWENSSAGFVPYTGAVTTVNLGAQSILAGSFVKAGGTSTQFLKADGSVDSNTYLTTGSAAATYVPYTGATADVNLGTHDLTAERGTFENNGSSDTLTVNHTSGSGYGIKVTKGGSNEALYVSKTSGSGNAMTVIGGRTSLVDLALSTVTNTAGDFLTLSGGVVHKRTAAEVRTDIGAGTVTSVAALTLGTTGTDLSSTVANGTTTPVITLNVPTASATNRGALSSADWTTFNNKENAITAGTTAQYFRGDKTFQTLNTSVVPEGTNLYYTEARVNANTNVAANTAARHNAVTLGTANGLSLSTQVLSLGLASAGVTGALSGTDWSTFNNKQNALTLTTTGTSGAATLVGSTLNIPQYQAAGTYVTSVTASSPLASSGGTTPNITIQQASGSQNGFLSSTDWTTFNNKQNVLTNPVTGTGSSGQVAYWSSSSAITGESNLFWDATNDRLGIGIPAPVYPLHVKRASNINIGIGQQNSGISLEAVNDLVNANIPMSYYASAHYFFNGNIGINTAFSGINTPSQLTIKASIADGNQIYLVQSNDDRGWRFKAQTDGHFYLQSAYTSSNSNVLKACYDTGNVLIGTVNDAGFKLDVNGTGKFNQNVTIGNAVAATNIKLLFNGVANKAAGIEFQQSGTPQWYLGNGIASEDNNFELYNSNGTMAMKITKSTNAINFIGAATFSSSVTAGGFLTNAASGTAGQEAIRINNDNGYIGFFNGANNTRSGYIQGNTTDLTIATSPSNPIIFATANAEKMRIHQNGNIVFKGQSTATSGESLFQNNDSALSFYSTQTSVLASKEIRFFTKVVSGEQRMTILANGNILIGTTTDNGPRLQVSPSASSWISGTFAGTGGTNKVVIGNYEAVASIGAHSNALDAWANLAINFGGGNVMVGTNTDSGDKLRVAGTTFSNTLMTWNPANDNRSGVAWRLGAASIGTDILNRRLRVNVGGVEYYIGAVEV